MQRWLFIIFVACQVGIAHAEIEHEQLIVNQLEQLNIEVVGEFKQRETTLPEDLTAGAQWGVVTPNCKAGGYDLSAVAGKDILVTTAKIAEPGNDSKHLRVHIATYGDQVVCVYKSNAAAIPGVYPGTMNFEETGRGHEHTYDEAREPEQGVMIPCEICVILYPKKYAAQPKTCPLCHGSKEHFQPAQMMTEEMAAQKAKEIDAAIQHIYDTTDFDDPKSDGFLHKYEEIRSLQHKRLIHALIYNESEIEEISGEIRKLDEILGSPITVK